MCWKGCCFFRPRFGKRQGSVRSCSSTDNRTMLNNRQALLKSPGNVALDPTSVGHHFRLHHPGLTTEGMDSFGNPSLVSLVGVERSCRHVAMCSLGADGRSFLDMDLVKQTHLIFLAASLYTISRHTYDTKEKTQPLRVDFRMGHVGCTSFSFDVTITLPSGCVMMTIVHQIVLIDPSTRRPTRLPDDWRHHYTPRGVRQQGLVVSQQYPPDSNRILTEEPIRLSVATADTDYNHHTNFASYIRFAADAVYWALKNGTLNHHLTVAEVRCGVSEVKVTYRGESSAGDVLLLRLWCPLAEQRTVVCCMQKEGEQPVCQVTLTFHDHR